MSFIKALDLKARLDRITIAAVAESCFRDTHVDLDIPVNSGYTEDEASKLHMAIECTKASVETLSKEVILNTPAENKLNVFDKAMKVWNGEMLGENFVADLRNENLIDKSQEANLLNHLDRLFGLKLTRDTLLDEIEKSVDERVVNALKKSGEAALEDFQDFWKAINKFTGGLGINAFADMNFEIDDGGLLHIDLTQDPKIDENSPIYGHFNKLVDYLEAISLIPNYHEYDDNIQSTYVSYSFPQVTSLDFQEDAEGDSRNYWLILSRRYLNAFVDSRVFAMPSGFIRKDVEEDWGHDSSYENGAFRANRILEKELKNFGLNPSDPSVKTYIKSIENYAHALSTFLEDFAFRGYKEEELLTIKDSTQTALRTSIKTKSNYPQTAAHVLSTIAGQEISGHSFDFRNEKMRRIFKDLFEAAQAYFKAIDEIIEKSDGFLGDTVL